MINRRHMILGTAAIGALSQSVIAQTPQQSADVERPLPDEQIQTLLRDRIAARQSIGMVVGVIEHGKRRIVAAGRLGKDDARVPTDKTVFGIASLTKPFVALLLADAVRRGELSYESTAQSLLPAGVKLPQHNGKEITLLDLATHTTGLPHDLPNREVLSASAITVKEARAALYEFLAIQKLSADPGINWSYSNLDYALIGHVLEQRTGLDYATLLERRITGPLGMSDTRPTSTPEMQTRRASPHRLSLEPSPEWNKPWMGGVLQSTASDLLTFVAACSGETKTALTPAIDAMLKVRRPAPTIGAQQAVGWFMFGTGPSTIVGHSGAGGGFSSTALFEPHTKTGVVLLSNAEILQEDLARHILRPSLKLDVVQAEFALTPEALDKYVGEYRDESGAVTIIRRDAGILVLVMPAGYKAPLTPTDANSFFVRGYAGLTATIELDPNGNASVIRWTLAGKTTVARR